MNKKRTIDTKIRASETFACLTYRQRDLWIGLILVCDDQGRLPGHPAYVRSAVWPYDDVLLADVETDLSALQSLGNILRYHVDGKTYIQLVNWHKYQADAEWLGRSEYPAPDGWVDHARYHGKAKAIITLNWEDRKTSPTLNQGTAKVQEQEAQNEAVPCHDDDVNVKGNDEGDVNGDDEVEAGEPGAVGASDPYDVMQRMAEQMTGCLAKCQEDALMITEFLKAEVIQADIQGALNYFESQDIPIKKLSSIRKSVLRAAYMRLHPSPSYRSRSIGSAPAAALPGERTVGDDRLDQENGARKDRGLPPFTMAEFKIFEEERNNA